METVNLHTDLLTNIYEKQIAIRDLVDQLAHEYDDIKDSDRSKAVAIRDMADKQGEHLNELETKLDSIEKLDQDSIEIALQYQGFSEENKIRCSVEIGRVDLEYGKGFTDTDNSTQEEIKELLLSIWKMANHLDSALAFKNAEQKGESVEDILPPELFASSIPFVMDNYPDNLCVEIGALAKQLGINLHQTRTEQDRFKENELPIKEETEDEANDSLHLPATMSVKVEQILCLCHALDNYILENPESGIVGAIEDAAKVLGEMLGAMEGQSRKPYTQHGNVTRLTTDGDQP